MVYAIAGFGVVMPSTVRQELLGFVVSAELEVVLEIQISSDL